MNRYLLNISYIGTTFRGIQKTKILSDPSRLDTNTVQGCIELGLQKLRSVNPIEVHLSSRTDAGVHALNSTVHVDLIRYDGKPYCPDAITSLLNRFFFKHSYNIRILKTTHVPEDFHCRHNAHGRTYLYRIAVAKTAQNRAANRYCHFSAFIPIEDISRCFYVQDQNLDIDTIRRTSRLFIGFHDFRSFMSTTTNRPTNKQHMPMYTLRSISDIKIRKSYPPINSIELEQANSLYDYWEIEITGRSFLYKQVRRIVGSLIAAAGGFIQEKDIYEMLTIPSKNTWNSRILLAPAFGLYLCKVHYNEEDLKFKTVEQEEDSAEIKEISSKISENL